MAEALKDAYGPEVPARIAAMVAAVHDGFDTAAFLADALEGYQGLELTPRARRIADALWRALPGDFPSAVRILRDSLGPPIADDTIDGQGMATFVYLPHVFLVAAHGLEHFELSMDLQHELTRRFTAEFSIRAFIEAHPERTLQRLAEWVRDPSPHVRRLVSEGTRPRLPWATRLRALQADPAPILPLLEALRDDPSEYVRRSVANNLNDISKDHPLLVTGICERWMRDADPPRRALVRHALRTLTRAGDPAALAVLGFAAGAEVAVDRLTVAPAEPRVGQAVRVGCTLRNDAAVPLRALVHLRVHFVTARGTGPKVFLVGERTLAPGAAVSVTKAVSLRQHTTRTHRPGRHRLEILVNGAVCAEGAFTLSP